MNNVSNEVNDVMATIIGATKKYLEPLKEGERTTISDLLDKVVKETGIGSSKARGLISVFLGSKESGVEVSSGQNGGIFKGKKIRNEDTRKRCPECSQVIRSGFNKGNSK